MIGIYCRRRARSKVAALTGEFFGQRCGVWRHKRSSTSVWLAAYCPPDLVGTSG